MKVTVRKADLTREPVAFFGKFTKSLYLVTGGCNVFQMDTNGRLHPRKGLSPDRMAKDRELFDPLYKGDSVTIEF